MWFVYGPRYADESFKFKIVYEKFICNSLLLLTVFRMVYMLIFVMKRRIPRYYCTSFVFQRSEFCYKRVFCKAAETSVNFIWKALSKTWYLQENISHLCCYDESFKSGYNFGTAIKEGLYILGYFAVSARCYRRFEGTARLPSVCNFTGCDVVTNY